MAVKKRHGQFYIYFRPFREKQIGLSVDVQTKSEAKQIEAVLLRACRTGDYSMLDSTAREVCQRMFENQGWEMPAGLGGFQGSPVEELTLWKAAERFLKYPEIRACQGYWRHECALANLVAKLGKDTPIKSVWVPTLKAYQMGRVSEGAQPSTVNRELSTLSRLFGVMIEMQLVEVNPVRLVKRLSEKTGERQVYLSFGDVQKIMDHCPEWFRPIVLTAYYTGMRRGEIFNLTRKQVNLAKRLITLAPQDTKEVHWKRVPVHKDLVPVLEEVLKVSVLGTDQVFLLRDDKGTRPLAFETLRNPWPRACESLGLPKPRPVFHDLRHTWRTNARRSGMDAQIAEGIMGHWLKGKSVNDRYGRISDPELLKAIDSMTFNHGDTEILVAGGRS